MYQDENSDTNQRKYVEFSAAIRNILSRFVLNLELPESRSVLLDAFGVFTDK